jgi:hypothetical protein
MIARSYRPQVESLEGRTLPSSLPVVGPPHETAVHAAPHVLLLSGTIGGTWTLLHTIPDTGGKQALMGQGTVHPLGPVEASGTLYTPGFIGSGHAEIELRLSAGKGSVKLLLVGPLQRGFSHPPTSFHYTIVSGTGAFAGATGNGTAAFHEKPAQMSHCPPGELCPLYFIAPSFGVPQKKWTQG